MKDYNKQYVLYNYGEFVSYFDKEHCWWAFLSNCAMVFPTYSKAYSAMQKINKKYGYKRCHIENLNTLYKQY